MAKRATRAKPARPKPATAKPELQASANAPAPRNSAREANSGFGDDQRTGLPLKRIGDGPPEGVGPNGLTPTESLRLLDRKPDAGSTCRGDDGATARILPDIVQRSAWPLHPMRDGLTFGEYMPWRR